MDNNFSVNYTYIHNGLKWYAMPIGTCDNWCDVRYCTFLMKHKWN